MKKTFSIISFVVSTGFFLYFLYILVSFIVAIFNYPMLETNGDLLGVMITILAYSTTFLFASVLGLPFAVLCTRISSDKFLKICSKIEIAFFSIGIIFPLFQIFFKR